MAARKLTVYLPPNLDAKVRKAARDQHRSELSIVLEEVLKPGSNVATSPTLSSRKARAARFPASMRGLRK